MTEVPQGGATAIPDAPRRPGSQRPGGGLQAGLADAAVTLGWFLLVGVLVGVAWWLLTDLPQATQSQGRVVVAADQLGLEVGIDGWFFVLSALTGLVSGIALLVWRSRDPLLMVVLVTLGGGLASYVARLLGGALGPEPETSVLRTRPDGARAPMQLQVHATGVLWVLPAAAALGALVYFWVIRRPESQRAAATSH